MANIGSALRTPEQLRPAPTVSHRAAYEDQNDPVLLELRTGAESVYVRPSRWQRFRLQWTFRHFHVLPAQVLSRSDQRLIEKLSQSAVVTPSIPVVSGSVFGVVEKTPSKSPATANRVIPLRRELAAVPRRETSPVRVRQPFVIDIPSGPWAALGILAAVGLIVIVATVHFRPQFLTAVYKAPAEAAVNAVQPDAITLPVPHPAVANPHPVPGATVSVLNPAKPMDRIAPTPPELAPVHHEASSIAAPSSVGGPAQSTSSAAKIRRAPASATVPDTNTSHTIPGPVLTALPAPQERRFVAELPQGRFARPVVSDPRLAGELQLKALIGADGSVKDVSVLSGDPALAEAGMRAVRQWHYNPAQLDGSPAGVETRIKMNFFGGDGVSIASVANRSASQSR